MCWELWRMKRYWLTGLCGLLLGIILCGAAAASEVQDVSVKINGQTVIFEEEVKMVDGRAYLPFRGIFQALGFEDSAITFDGRTGTVCAESQELTVSMVIGEERMRVTRNGKTQILSVDAPAFIDPVLGRAYIPARFAAEAAGYRLGWDGSSRTVILDDIEAILEGNRETYTVLEKYLELIRKYNAGNYCSKGEYSAEVIMETDNISVKGAYSMLLDSSGVFELEMPVELQAEVSETSLTEVLQGEPYLYACGKQGEGIHHIRIGEERYLSTETEQEWMALDLESVAEESYPSPAADYIRWLNPGNPGAVPQTARKYVEQLIYEGAQRDYSVSVPELLSRINALLGDSSFRFVRGSYINDKKDIVQMQFHTRKENITAYKFSVLQQATQSQPGIELQISVDGKKWAISLTLVETVNSYIHISMDGTMEPTGQRPKWYLP